VDVAIVLSVLSLLVAGGGLVSNEFRWRAERRSDVRVLAWHDGMGMDIYAAEAVDVEHVIAVRVFNHGERSEHVMWTGLFRVDPKAERFMLTNNPGGYLHRGELPKGGGWMRRGRGPAQGTGGPSE
jgi:hypothetical protein